MLAKYFIYDFFQSLEKQYFKKQTNHKGKTIFFIFGGRKDRMSLLMHYVEKLLDQKQIDYVHIWNFARTKEDYKWLKSLEDEEKKIFVFSFNNYFTHEITTSTILMWSLPYPFYRDPQFGESYFVKCDDDIVYIDAEKFNSFLDKVKEINQDSEHYMVSANVINNGACIYFQYNKYNFFQNIIFDKYLENPNRGFREIYHDSENVSEKLHNSFLENKKDFISKARSLSVELLDIDWYHSINFIGFKQEILPKNIDYKHFNDELF